MPENAARNLYRNPLMRKSPLFAVLLAAVAAGCGNPTSVRNKAIKPIAIITGPGAGPATTTIELDGSKSYDPNAVQLPGIFEWDWTLLSVPAGSQATIDDNNDKGELNADVAGHYVVQLVVRDINDFAYSDPTTYDLLVFPITGVAVTLAWNTATNDVDLHFIDQTAGGSLFDPMLDCFFQNMRPDWGPVGPNGDPSLNHDQVNGYGPETTVLAVPVVNEQYHVMAHYFSDDGLGPTDVDVTYWVNGTDVLEMHHDQLTANQVWDLATIQWTGADATITPIDTMSTY